MRRTWYSSLVNAFFKVCLSLIGHKNPVVAVVFVEILREIAFHFFKMTNLK